MSAIPPAVQQLLSAQQNAVKQQIGYTVAAKQLDAVEQQGQAVVELVQSAAALNKTNGAGDRFDAQA